MFSMSVMLNFCITIVSFILIMEIGYSFQECVLSLRKDLPKKHEPLYFIQKGKSLSMLMPHMIDQDGVMTLNDGQRLVLACPGKNNRLSVTGTESALSKCAGGVMLDIENRQFPAYQLECEHPVKSVIRITNEKCGTGKGVEVRIGFQSPNGSILQEPNSFSIWRIIGYLWSFISRSDPVEEPTSHWINLVTTCHNFKESQSLYSTHIIYGKSLAGAEMKWIRPQFTVGNDKLYPGFNPDLFYKKQHQRCILRKLLGCTASNRILQENFISRGHLTPDADFLFGSWQYMTYTYVNSAPQWLSINAGNWQQIERCIRQFAITTRSNLLVITGTFGILSLPNFDDKYKDVYLHPEEKKIPVPKYFWKVIQDPEKKACIAFVCTNNPFLMKAPNKMCHEICTRSGWPMYGAVFTKGYIYCCEINDLRNKIPTIPQLECLSLLVGPKAFYNYRN